MAATPPIAFRPGTAIRCASRATGPYNQWDLGLIAKFNSSLTVRLHVGDYTMSKDQTITPNDFNGVGGTYTLPPWDDKIGIDEIEYTLEAQLLKA